MQYFKFFSTFVLAFAVLFALGCASTPTQSSLGEVIDDTVITTRVKAAIFNEPTLTSSEINVETVKGEVQLSGFVGSRAEINRAVALSRDVGGVISVRNGLQVE
ncbi:MAG: BON domain-containing protein [Pseudohongiellaceae bacterium]